MTRIQRCVTQRSVELVWWLLTISHSRLSLSRPCNTIRHHMRLYTRVFRALEGI